MARLCLTILVSFFAFSAFAQSSSEDLFQKGLAAYQKRNYDEARAAFEGILAQGVVSARVLHNLALTNYQLNNRPQALALWRKALAVDPGFKEARAGRDLLESRFNMRPFERDSLASWKRHMLEYVSIYQLLWVTALVLSLTGWLWLRYTAERRHALEEDRPLPTFPYTAVMASFVLLLTASLSFLKVADMFTTRATVVTEKASLLSLPAEDAVPLVEVPGGSEVLVRREGQGWLQVLDSGGFTGWVKNAELLVTSER